MSSSVAWPGLAWPEEASGHGTDGGGGGEQVPVAECLIVSLKGLPTSLEGVPGRRGGAGGTAPSR